MKTDHSPGDGGAPAQVVLVGVPMNAAELQAERELVADLQRMARTIQMGLAAGEESPAVWKDRREQIGVLRQRIRTMRAQHLGVSWALSTTTPR